MSGEAKHAAPAPPPEAAVPPGERRRPLEVLLGGRDIELWVRLAFLLWIPAFAGAAYVASRPGGAGPIAVYRRGPDAVLVAALALLIYALARSALRRPFLQRGRRRGFLALALLTFCAMYPLPYPSSHSGHRSRAEIRLPIEGAWTVRWGGEVGRRNAWFLQPDRCYGYFLWRPDEAEGGFGAPVLAPADAGVVAVHGEERDRTPSEAWDGAEPLGNWICLEVAPHQYLFLSSLRRGSLAVAPGERVRSGQRLAEVGSSDATRTPHLSVHLQDTPEPRAGEAIPFAFRGYRAGGRVVGQGVPAAGERVEPADPAPDAPDPSSG